MKRTFERIRSTIRGHSQNSEKLDAQQSLNFCTPEQFVKRLSLEKRRAERLNSKLSFIRIDVSEADSTGQRKGRRRARTQKIRNLAQAICTLLRETDAVSIYRGGQILIALPDTDKQSAGKVCERLFADIQRYRLREGQPAGFQRGEVQVLIFAYPENPISDEMLGGAQGGNGQSNGDTPAFYSLRRRSPEMEMKRLFFAEAYLHLYPPLPSALSLPNDQLALGSSLPLTRYWGHCRVGAKRAIDIAGSIVALVFFSPLMLLVAAGIKLTSPGPVFYKQKRIGYQGRQFTFFKFRSMHVDTNDRTHRDFVKKLIKGDADETNHGTESSPLYKMKNDPRITPIGRLLRRTSLDELPQFWNVLKGDMSLVGPRPPLPYEVREYQNWHYRRVLEVNPGITGLWQVSGRSRTTFDEMVRMDIYYARHWSIGMDLKILAKTIKAVFAFEGT